MPRIAAVVDRAAAGTFHSLFGAWPEKPSRKTEDETARTR